MFKCLICDKDLTRGVPSAKKENGDYYLMCTDCGNVHYVKTLPNGLTELTRTSNDDTAETRLAMKEAAELFKKAGISVMDFKVGIHSEKQSAEELNDVLSEEQEMMLKLSYDSLPSQLRQVVSYESYKKDFNNFRKNMKNNPSNLLSGLVQDILEAIGNGEECDCEECMNQCNECEGCNGCDEYELTAEEVIKSSLPEYVLEGITPDGGQLVSTVNNKEELAMSLAEAEESGITVKAIKKVEVTLTPVTFSRETKYNIN